MADSDTHTTTLTAEDIRRKAREFGAAAVGIGDIRYFAGCDPQRDPRAILPHATCVIGCAFRIPRALYAAMARREQFYNYTQLGVKFVDEDLAEIFFLKLGGFIEDAGYDACLQRNVSNLRIKGDKTTNPELLDTYELIHAEPVAPGKPAPDIILDFNEAARICGLGAVGRSGHLIARGLGPFVRLVFIVTDAPLECDAPCDAPLCDDCGACRDACPGHAIGPDGTDTWQCAVTYRGAFRANPFLTADTLRDEPGRDDILDGRRRFDSESARALYPRLDFLPSRPIGYAPCLCGRACDVACHNHLKERRLI